MFTLVLPDLNKLVVNIGLFERVSPFYGIFIISLVVISQFQAILSIQNYKSK